MGSVVETKKENTMEFDWKTIDAPERARTYIFPTGELRIENVSRLCVRSSGTHRIETTNGNKYIVPTGWLGIKLEMEAWSF